MTNAQQQDPTTMNGGSVLAMAGDGCVALAVDKRFGSGPQVRTWGTRITCSGALLLEFTHLSFSSVVIACRWWQ